MNARVNRSQKTDKTNATVAGNVTARATFDTMLARHRRFLRRRRSGGASLVEVLVVLVILLLGVFAVIRVWPIGFGTLRASERRLRADRLNRNTLDQIAGADAANLPESIDFTFFPGTTPYTVTGAEADPDNLGVYNGDPANKLYFSDVNKFRYIKNEPVKVPSPTSTLAGGGDIYGGGSATTGRGSIYLLKFGPIYMARTYGNPEAAPSTPADIAAFNAYLKVTGEPLIGLAQDSENGTNADQVAFRLRRSGGSYLIDYGGDGSGGAYILLPSSSRDRTYTITYSYEDSSGGTATIKQAGPISITVAGTPANTPNYQWYPLNVPGPTNADDGIVRGSEQVKVDFERLPASSAWDPGDPYQYKLLSDNVSDYANFGVIAFNPAGANFSERTAYGQRAFTAQLSYAVLDWHIIRDDREVPTGIDDGSGLNIAQIRTTLPNIRPKGDDLLPDEVITPGQTTYEGLYPGIAPANQVDIQVFNLSTPNGLPLVVDDYKDRATNAGSTDVWVNRDGRNGSYPTGVLFVNTNRVAPGTRLRVLYKVQGNWAVAVQKAVTLYDVVPNATRPPDGAGGTGTGVPADCAFDGDRLYFWRSELNKSVVAAVECDTPAGIVRLSPAQFTIDNADGDYAYVDLTRYFSLPPTRTAIRLVNQEARGASLRTRVIYKDNTSSTNPWRVQDLETFVTPAQGQN